MTSEFSSPIEEVLGLALAEAQPQRSCLLGMLYLLIILA